MVLVADDRCDLLCRDLPCAERTRHRLDLDAVAVGVAQAKGSLTRRA
jgi:hypothetical protein